MAGDQILEAKTVGAFMAAVDEVYGRKLPIYIGPGTDLEQIWASEITVSKDPSPGVYYQANGVTPLSIAKLASKVFVTVGAPSNEEAQ